MTLPAMEEQLREAIVTGAYGKAQALLAEYCACAEREGTPDRAREFLQWSRSVVLASRARIADEIAQLASVASYAAAKDDRRTWRLEA